jgi:hypothetical protein
MKVPCCRDEPQTHLLLSVFVFVFCNVCCGGAAICNSLAARKALQAEEMKVSSHKKWVDKGIGSN